jgi:predicted aspartyl protease
LHAGISLRRLSILKSRNQDVKVMALVDTGATFTVVLWEIHERLGLMIDPITGELKETRTLL